MVRRLRKPACAEVSYPTKTSTQKKFSRRDFAVWQQKSPSLGQRGN